MTATAQARHPTAAESQPRQSPGESPGQRPDKTPAPRGRLLPVAFGMLTIFAAIGGQMLNLAFSGRNEARLASAEPIVRVHARPDIIDRQGRIIATDVDAASLFADPALLIDLDEIIEKLTLALPTLDEAELRKNLSDRSRRFAWIKRGMAPVEAQRVHELGLPGLAFRREPKRVYPSGALTGHIVGQVNVDNRGQAGIEHYIDETMGLDAVSGAVASRLKQVRLSLDLGVQHSVADELQSAMTRYAATAAAGLVLDIRNGEIVAAVSLPSVDPNRPAEALDPARPERLQGGVFELGSIFKLLTVAMALEDGRATLDKIYDVTKPLEIGRFTIKDAHPSPSPLSVRDIFLHSSNVGAGLMALEGGTERQLMFLARMGLTEPMRIETGTVAPPLLPKRWDRIETVTISYGHGLAVAPLQFAAVAAALLNGGHRVTPTYIATGNEVGSATTREALREAILAPATSAAIREIMRLNVTSKNGTGHRADVTGYRVGGKTGTAEMPGENGYQRRSVIASFAGALPMDEPRYLTLVTLFEPQPTAETRGQITAAVNAAPVTARIITRIAPILGILPRRLDGADTKAD